MKITREMTPLKLAAVAGVVIAAGGAFAVVELAGSSSSGSSTVQRATAAPGGVYDVGSAPQQVRSGATHGSPRSSNARTRGAAATTGPVQRARGVAKSASSEQTTPGVKGPNPCTYVPTVRAQSIAGGVISTQVAPLGPTCIYAQGGAKPPITVAIESMSFTQITRQLHQAQQLTIGGHSAYCGTLGREMLFLSLSGGRVLNVTAPCSEARQFAAAAIGHITA
jgi:hypothetical protein